MGLIEFFQDGGEGGIRTRDTFQYTRFPSERTRPLCDLSVYRPRWISKLRIVLFVKKSVRFANYIKCGVSTLDDEVLVDFICSIAGNMSMRGSRYLLSPNIFSAFT